MEQQYASVYLVYLHTLWSSCLGRDCDWCVSSMVLQLVTQQLLWSVEWSHMHGTSRHTYTTWRCWFKQEHVRWWWLISCAHHTSVSKVQHIVSGHTSTLRVFKSVWHSCVSNGFITGDVCRARVLHTEEYCIYIYIHAICITHIMLFSMLPKFNCFGSRFETAATVAVSSCEALPYSTCTLQPLAESSDRGACAVCGLQYSTTNTPSGGLLECMILQPVCMHMYNSMCASTLSTLPEVWWCRGMLTI